jgi:photosystem II stability/assembly factor-like uncharacterized protein
MKVIAILSLVLMLNASCQEIRTTAIESKNTDFKNLEKKDTKEAIPASIKLVGRNAHSVYDFVFSDSGEIVGVGIGNESGYVYVSNDMGKSWKKEEAFVQNDKGSVKGIIKKGGDIYATNTGGMVIKRVSSETKWERISKPDPKLHSATYFRYIEFANDEIGYAVSEAFSETEHGSRIFQTQDGGKTWKMVYENILSGMPFDLLVIDEKTAIVAMNDEYILRTEDGGKTWKPQELESTGKTIKEDDWIDLKNNGASDLTLSNGIVWVVGEKGSLYYSDDKGKTWKRPDKMPDSIRQQELKSIAFSTDGKGVAVGENGYIIISEDNGKTWNEVSNDVLTKNILKNEVSKNLDRLVKVKFDNEKAIVLGLQGVYAISF